MWGVGSLRGDRTRGQTHVEIGVDLIGHLEHPHQSGVRLYAEVCLANLNRAAPMKSVGCWFQVDVDAGRAGLPADSEVASEMRIVLLDYDLLGREPEFGVAVGVEHLLLDVALDLQAVFVRQRLGPTMTFAHLQTMGVDPDLDVTQGQLARVDSDLARPPRRLDEQVVTGSSTESLAMRPDQESRILRTDLEGGRMDFHTVDATPFEEVSRAHKTLRGHASQHRRHCCIRVACSFQLIPNDGILSESVDAVALP